MQSANQEERLNSTIFGAAGEHYVMCQLLRQNMIAALAPAGVPNADIVVTDKLGNRLCAVQVKVRRERGSDGGWHMGQKHETIVSPNLFYCFVDFGRGLADQPKCWIVPSAVVAHVVTTSHRNWLAAPGRGGRVRNDSKMRRFLPDYAKLGLGAEYGFGWLEAYEEKWGLLQAATK
jgi:hypothetical protein